MTWALLRLLRPTGTNAPWLVIALLCAGLAWHFETRAVANAEALRTQAQTYRAAQVAASAAAQAALAQTEARYHSAATEAAHDYDAALAAADQRADRYIATHRLPPATLASGASQPATAAADHHPGVSGPMPAAAVVVSADDVQACSAAAAYALNAHEWAQHLIAPEAR